ncbi:MAG: acylphosphatase [Proteobacteria bacterium SG_bin5]|nr:acylphosphatase [Sphingomonas sp.]OQW39739.1 MAG: acylphosphatase [Proteobacteria bacterium SG_bin5]
MQRVFISGKVQNCGFRDYMVRRASELHVAGWVRNLRDGRVELLVAGDPSAIEALLDAARQGPPRARVDHLEIQPAEERLPKGFTKRFTA